jgi:hypothetical protein
MRELNIPGYKDQTEFNMLKVLDTYKRSVDYYNSHGLPSKTSNNARALLSNGLRSPAQETFWNDTLRL